MAIICLSFSACGGDGGGGTDPCANCQKIGDTGPGGGIIFYHNHSGFWYTFDCTFSDGSEDDHVKIAHYLEAALVDQATYDTSTETGGLAWASSGKYSTYISTMTGIGYGKKNTIKILHEDANAPAAKACKDYRGPNNKDDWFLPSKDELNEMYKAKSHLGTVSVVYWSSSQDDSSSAWYQFFTPNGQGKVSKNYKQSVRAIRAF